MDPLARLRAIFLVAIAACVHAMRPAGFSYLGPSGRFATAQTPVIFSFNNPRDSSGAIRIWNSRNRLIRTLTISPGDTSETWNGRDGDGNITGGVYLYVISIEGLSYSGTIAVIQ